VPGGCGLGSIPHAHINDPALKRETLSVKGGGRPLSGNTDTVPREGTQTTMILAFTKWTVLVAAESNRVFRRALKIATRSPLTKNTVAPLSGSH